MNDGAATLLVVDDEEAIRRSMRKYLTLQGYEVAVAASGEEALTVLGRQKIAALLLDVNLPGINGLDATRQILAERADPVIVLLLSTYEEEEYAPRAAECGAAAYIPKAVFGPDRLEAAWADARSTA